MQEDLKARGNKTAIRRAVAGLIGGIGLFAMFYLNIFGISEETYARWKWIGLGALALVVIASAVNLARATGASGMTKIKKYCAGTPNPDATMARLEQTWRNGLDFKQGRIDTEYVIMSDGLATKVIALQNAIWAYKYVAKVNNVNSVFVCLEYREGKSQRCSLGLHDSAADQIVAYFMHHCPSVSVGYDKEREQMFKAKDWNGLLENARTQRIAAGIGAV